VPYVNDLARTPEDRQAIEFLYAGTDIGRPFLAPPGLAPDMLTMLRDAFSATMTDPEFLADARKQKLDVTPEDGEHVAAIVRRITGALAQHSSHRQGAHSRRGQPKASTRHARTSDGC
jgi:hypothetical protein